MNTQQRILKELGANEAISPNNLSLNAYVASNGLSIAYSNPFALLE